MHDDIDVSIDDLFTDDFIEKYTAFNNINEFLQAAGIENVGIDEIGKLDEDDLGEFVKTNTSFLSWAAMKESAANALMMSTIGSLFPPREEKQLILYKYRQINEFTDDLIANNNHYFATCRELNDPFELKFDLELRDDPNLSKELKKLTSTYWLAEGIKGVKPWIYYNYFPKLYKKWIAKHGYPESREKYKHAKEQVLLAKVEDSIGVCSFSKEPDHTLMFSHYADSHKGISIGFKFNQKEIKNVFGPEAVRYTNNFPVWKEFPQDGHMDEVIRPAVLTKSRQWEYENEFRCFSMYKRGVINLSSICEISEITLGANISPENQKHVLSLVSKLDKKIKVYRASIVKGTYDLSKQEIL